MKFENIRVSNFENALRGMRNPLESWKKSDSIYAFIDIDSELDFNKSTAINKLCCDYCEKSTDSNLEEVMKKVTKWLRTNSVIHQEGNIAEIAMIGPNDLSLACRLIKAGPEHRKFLRQIQVSVDITAPLYW